MSKVKRVALLADAKVGGFLCEEVFADEIHILRITAVTKTHVEDDTGTRWALLDGDILPRSKGMWRGRHVRLASQADRREAKRQALARDLVNNWEHKYLKQLSYGRLQKLLEILKVR